MHTEDCTALTTSCSYIAQPTTTNMHAALRLAATPHAHLHWISHHWRQLIRQLEHAGLLLLLNCVLLALPHAWRQLWWRRHAQ